MKKNIWRKCWRVLLSLSLSLSLKLSVFSLSGSFFFLSLEILQTKKTITTEYRLNNITTTTPRISWLPQRVKFNFNNNNSMKFAFRQHFNFIPTSFVSHLSLPNFCFLFFVFFFLNGYLQIWTNGIIFSVYALLKRVLSFLSVFFFNLNFVICNQIKKDGLLFLFGIKIKMKFGTRILNKMCI